MAIRVESSAGSYPVRVERGMAARLGSEIREVAAGATVLVVCDANTGPRLAEALAAELGATLHVVPAGETSKGFAELERATRAAASARLGRDGLVVAVGGGVVGDLAGLLAAVYLRGVRLVHVPTTLLAQVDSAIGGKTGIDLPEGKNLVGVFKSPEAVLVDPDLLSSLPAREYLSGLAEVAKYSMIKDEHMFALLMEERDRVLARDLDLLAGLVETCCAIKAEVVSGDEREGGERAILNYGHTFGHALEAATGYGRFTHGEAISVGMEVAAKIGREAGVTSPEVLLRQAELFDALGLPRRAPGAATVESVLEPMARDKKSRRGEVEWVLLEGVGHASAGHRVEAGWVRSAAAAALAEVGG